MAAEPDFYGLLALLTEHEVEFVLVGGVAAILHGVPVMTEDLDVVYRVEARNLERLAAALRTIDAVYRDPAGRRIIPTVEHLERYRVNLFDSTLGFFDALRTIGDEVDYAVLIERALKVEIDDMTIRVADLETVIASKEHANRPKDRATLPILRHVLRRQRAGEDR